MNLIVKILLGIFMLKFHIFKYGRLNTDNSYFNLRLVENSLNRLRYDYFYALKYTIGKYLTYVLYKRRNIY